MRAPRNFLNKEVNSAVEFRSMKHHNYAAWAIVLLGSLTCAAIPFAFTAKITGNMIPTTILQLEQDSIYYLIQVKRILEGHITIGNPYFLEYAGASFPGLLLPLWLAAIPGIFGLNINAVYATNIVAYSVLTGALMFSLCKKIDKQHAFIAVMLAVLGVASMHNNLLRPGIMQTVYPNFILFMMAFLWVLRKPHDTKAHIALGVMAAFSFYLYPFLWVTAFAAIGFLTLRTLLLGDTKALRLQIAMGIGITIACVPQLLTVFALFHDPAAHELNIRVGLTSTHLVLPLTIFNMKYVIGGTAALLLLRLQRKLTPAELMIAFVGGAMFIGSISNLITGKQMDFDTHFYRLSLPWNIAAISVFVAALYSAKTRWQQAITGIAITALLLTSLSRAVIRMNAFGYTRRTEYFETTYAKIREQEPLFAFLQTLPPHQVLLTNLEIATYVPLYTTHYILFHTSALLNTVPTSELLTRFLIFHVDRITPEFLRQKLVYVVGIGYKHKAWYESTYGRTSTYLDYAGGETLVDQAMTEFKDINAHYDAYLKKFQVRYVITDALETENPRVPRSATVVYEDGRFTVYSIKE